MITAARKSTKTSEAPEKALRLLFMAHNHPKIFPGGAEGFAYNLFNYFKTQPDVNASFIAATDPIHSTVYSGTPLTAYDGKDDEMLLQAGAFDYFTQSLRNPKVLTEHLTHYLEEEKPDIIHLHHTMRLGMETLAIIKRTLPDAKIVYTLHDFIPLCHRDGQMVRTNDNRLCDSSSTEHCHQCFPDITAARFKMREQLIRGYFDRVDAFISPSKFLAKRFMSWGIDEEKMHILSNGIEKVTPAPQRKLAKKEPHTRFSYFGQITPYKGVLLLCEAANILEERGVKVSINIYGHIGEQTEAFQEQFMQAVDHTGEHVKWHGRYRMEDIPALMANTDWVVAPSTWWENAPLVIDEAFAHKRPVICADVGGMAEKVQHKKSGLHFRHGSSESLASAMRAATANPESWQKMTKSIIPPTTIKDSAAAHEALYRSILD